MPCEILLFAMRNTKHEKCAMWNIWIAQSRSFSCLFESLPIFCHFFENFLCFLSMIYWQLFICIDISLHNIASHLRSVTDPLLTLIYLSKNWMINNFKCNLKHDSVFKCKAHGLSYKLPYKVHQSFCFKVALIGTPRLSLPITNVMNFLFLANNPSTDIYSIQFNIVYLAYIYLCYIYSINAYIYWMTSQQPFEKNSKQIKSFELWTEGSCWDVFLYVKLRILCHGGQSAAIHLKVIIAVMYIDSISIFSLTPPKYRN